MMADCSPVSSTASPSPTPMPAARSRTSVELYERYQQQANFIHVEPWDLRIARGEGRLAPANFNLERKLPTELWVSVVDRSRSIAARFEGMDASDEPEGAISAVRQ